MSDDNVVRITNQRSQRVYVTFLLRLLQGGPDKDGVVQPKCDTVTISAMGRAIHNAVNIAEIVKRRVVGLHQITTISSETIDDSNKEDAGDDHHEHGKGSRKASVISIKLSRKQLNTKDIGYQAPLPESMITAEEPFESRPPRAPRDETRGGSSRGGPRGGRGGSRGGPRGGSRGGPRGGSRGGPRGGRGAY